MLKILLNGSLTPILPGGSVPNMRFRDLVSIVFALALCCASLFGQTVASSVVGAIVDPADAVVAGVPVTLISVETGAVRTGTTDSNGTFPVSYTHLTLP